jgi:hypothetical protein
MAARVYVLISARPGRSLQIARALMMKPGVVTADLLEGPPDVVMVVEANDEGKLAEFTVKALASVEKFTEELRLLPVQTA